MINTFTDQRPTLMKYNLWGKTPFDGRQPLMEDDLGWKMIIDWWKAIFDGRQSFKEDALL